jgi:hypothetical protein
MRIVRYPLEIIDYQQLQPLWPGRVLSVGIGRDPSLNGVAPTIDMWCVDNDTARGDRLPPVLGVWVVGTGNDIDPAMFERDAIFHGTVDMRRIPRIDGHLSVGDFGVWHVFTAVIGLAAEPEREGIRAGTVDEMAQKIRDRHARARGIE